MGWTAGSEVDSRQIGDMSALGHPEPEACRDQLQRILGNPEFQGSGRDRSFLSYVVEETLAGRGERIKAYSIGTVVFGRDASFDAQNDPIVRVQAGHLRRALESYYQSAGRADPIIISIPRGRYVPDFALQTPAAGAPEESAPTPPPEAQSAEPAPVRRQLRLAFPAAIALALAGLGLIGWTKMPIRPGEPAIPYLLVRPLESLSGPSSDPIARGLTEEVISEISKFKDIAVVEEAPPGQASTAASLASPYILSGKIALSESAFRLQVRVADQKSGRILWANSYVGDLNAHEIMPVETDLARQVATAIAQPYGVVFEADARRHVENAPDDWEAYSCTLRYYAYRANLDAATHPLVRKCLEQAVERYPSYATAWALLSQTYVDEIRFRYPVNPSSSSASVDRALFAAGRAIELDPQNVRGLQAEMFALYFNNDIGAALKVGEQARAINPNDTELMGEYGYRLALSGDWDHGCPLVAEARQRNPGPLAYYETALALCAYMLGDSQAAVAWIKKTPAPANAYYHLISAVIFAEFGSSADARSERNWLMQNAPALVKNIRGELRLRVARGEDVERFVASLKKAGLPISDD